MNGRLQDFDDIFNFCPKMQRESCLRLGSNHQHKLHICIKKYKVSWDYLIFGTKTKTVVTAAVTTAATTVQFVLYTQATRKIKDNSDIKSDIL